VSKCSRRGCLITWIFSGHKMNLNSFWWRPASEIFEHFGAVGENRRIFIDNGGSVLFVAHVDTVLPPRIKRVTKNRIFATGLDDRLGCDIAFSLSRELGADLLLTDLEEQGRSTAQFHDLKDYNWIVEFDRAGKDVVTYELDSPGFRDALLEYWNIGIGSFSDIAFMNTDACCFNLGIGYQGAHSEWSYVDLSVMKRQIAKFRRFWNKYKDIKFVQTYQDYDDYWIDYDEEYHDNICTFCGWKIGKYN